MQISPVSMPSFLSSRATAPGAAAEKQPAVAPTPVASPSEARPAPNFTASRLAALMNMSAPERPAMGETLLSPHMAMALQIPDSPEGGVQANSPARLYPSAGGPSDVTTEGLVREMLDKLGDGERISLADARAALATPKQAMIKNSEAKIDEYFDALDRDDSGSLERGELMTLMKHYQDWDWSRGKPRLPSTWA